MYLVTLPQEGEALDPLTRSASHRIASPGSLLFQNSHHPSLLPPATNPTLLQPGFYRVSALHLSIALVGKIPRDPVSGCCCFAVPHLTSLFLGQQTWPDISGRGQLALASAIPSSRQAEPKHEEPCHLSICNVLGTSGMSLWNSSCAVLNRRLRCGWCADLGDSRGLSITRPFRLLLCAPQLKLQQTTCQPPSGRGPLF